MPDETDSKNPLQAQPQIENIEIIELMGQGGMSFVYKARQKQLDRIVAVKVLSKMSVRGEDGIRRFQKEAKLTSTLDHPNVVKIISFGVSKDGQPYLVMEYLEGLSLADELKQNGRLKLQKFKDVFLPILSALKQAHELGLVHRDIKPGNIMICRNDTGTETVKLVDFGIAKFFGEGQSETQRLTQTGAVLGSPAYMSPEQCQGQPMDGRSDLYSMACVMYETLSGEPPFSGDSLLEVMQKQSVQPPPTVSDLSRKIDIHKGLAEVALWGLAKDPALRPQSASELARKLNEVLERITLDNVPTLKKSCLKSQISWMTIATAFLVVLTLPILCVIAYHPESKRSMDLQESLSDGKVHG
ncbi:MAG TPA: serine/threonine-protein kinase, partial [Candidatus Melainabacteria bacterium]|nr:serine/threonine-protein kinase [Candidatus Melainabacteria bacterium]